MELDFNKVYKNKYGDYRIIEQLPNSGRNQMVLIEFINENILGGHTRRVCQLSNVLYSKRGIKDIYQPTICGIACKGNADCNTNGKTRKEYNRWNKIILAVANSNNKLSVCDRWKCYEFFLEDVKLKPNYDKWVKSDKYQLIKDPRSNIYDNDATQIFSAELASFITTYNAPTDDLRYKTEYNGVYRIENSDNVQCRFNGRYYGTYNNPIAAANLYNLLFLNKFKDEPYIPEYLLNNVPKMGINEIRKYRANIITTVENKSLMYRLLDTENNNKTFGALIDELDFNKIWPNGGDPFKVIRDHHTVNGTHLADIQFINTNIFGEYTIRTNIAITRGNSDIIDDYYKPYIYGVACRGNAITVESGKNCYISTKEYEVWRNMISRCYNINDNQYKNYGAIGISVCKDWLCFECFLRDLPYLENYSKWKMYPSIYEIDKDELQSNIPHNTKVYSKKTCKFIPSLNNTLERHTRENINQTGYFGVFLHLINIITINF